MVGQCNTGYRLFDETKRKIVAARDVIFKTKKNRFKQQNEQK